jgi:hypothetical protein
MAGQIQGMIWKFHHIYTHIHIYVQGETSKYIYNV